MVRWARGRSFSLGVLNVGHYAFLGNNLYVHWNLCNSTTEFSHILWHPTKIYYPKVFLLTKIKPEYSDILYNPTHFSGPLVCRITQVRLYIYNCLDDHLTDFWRNKNIKIRIGLFIIIIIYMWNAKKKKKIKNSTIEHLAKHSQKM